MTGNYSRVAGAELAEWLPEDDEQFQPDPVENRHCKVDEMYFEETTGNLVITFDDRDTHRFFDLSIPVKATDDWNEFVESLPTWDV